MVIPRVRILDGDRTIVRDCVRACFFINAPHEACRGLALKCIWRYLELLPDGSIAFFVDDEGYTAELTRGNTMLVLQDKIIEGFEPGTGSVRLLGSDVEESGFYCYYYGTDKPSPSSPDYRNVLDFQISTELFDSLGTERFVAFCRAVALEVPHSFGYASPCLAASGARHQALAMTRRYPGFDVLEPGAAAVDLDDKAAGVYWLSFMGRSLTAALGGREAIARSMPGEVTVLTIGEDVLELRIGDEPEVGDTNRFDQLDIYRRVAEVLHGRLHLPSIAYFFGQDELVGDREATERWHRRFLD